MSLIASSSLLVDYILTVAVSVSAAVQAMVGYSIVGPYQTVLAVLCVFVLLLVNLRGVAESAKILLGGSLGLWSTVAYRFYWFL